MRANPSRTGLVAGLWFLTLCFFFVSANLIGAILLVLPSNSRLASATTRKIEGAQAAAHGWMSWTPVPWPDPASIDVASAFGRTTLNAFGPRATGKNSFQMASQYYGWPLPVIAQTQRWWDWNDPSLVPAGKVSQDLSGEFTEIRWNGLFIPAVAAAIAVWLPTGGLWLFVRRLRRNHRCCVECGYPTNASPVCTECGTVIEQSPKPA